MDPGGDRRRLRALVAALLLGALSLAVLGSLRPEIQAAATPRDSVPRFSLLAVGDTGFQRPLWFFDRRWAVSRALTRDALRDPVEGLLLLGDNFYPHGLRSGEAEARIRENVVGPYCAFMDLSGACSGRVADACSVPIDERHPVPIHVLFGNHDHDAPESPALQRDLVPCYVSQWRVHRPPVETLEVAEGVSLVLYDSMILRSGEGLAELTRALRESRGPWRIVAAHEPLDDQAESMPVRQAIRSADRAVHLHLAGHEHNLQVGVLGEGEPALQVVAGGGGEGREVKHPIAGSQVVLVSAGYARVDLVEEKGIDLLRVSLVTVPPLAQLWRRPRVATVWTVRLDGAVAREYPAP